MTTTTVHDLRETIAQAVRDRVHIDDVDETIIEPSGLTRDQKAALWLYAWSLQRPRVQRREARRMLELSA